MSSSVTVYSIFLFLYLYIFQVLLLVFVWNIAVNIKSCPFPICVISISGLLTASILFSVKASSNTSGAKSLKASS